MKKVAVTGATGFVGRQVVARLQKRGLEPTLVVRSPARVPTELQGLPILELDLLADTTGAYDLLGKPDIVIHLAWGGLPDYRSSHHLEEQLPAHKRFLGGLITDGLGTLTVAGTCLEYGDRSDALHEEMEPQPTTAYGQAKDRLRRYLEALQATCSYALTWARLFYLYGKGQSPRSLWPQLEAAAEQGKSQFDMSGGEQERDYLPIEEAADRLVRLSLLEANHGIVNVCSGAPVKVRRLVEKWIEDNGWNIRPNLGVYPYPTYEPMAFWGDDQKYQAIVAQS